MFRKDRPDFQPHPIPAELDLPGLGLADGGTAHAADGRINGQRTAVRTTTCTPILCPSLGKRPSHDVVCLTGAPGYESLQR